MDLKAFSTSAKDLKVCYEVFDVVINSSVELCIFLLIFVSFRSTRNVKCAILASTDAAKRGEWEGSFCGSVIKKHA